MTSTSEAREFQDRVDRLQSLLLEAERSADPAALARLREVVQALLDLHAAGLERVLDHVAAAPGGDAVLDACAADEVASGLLLLHGLHPLPLEDRVRKALDRVRPYLKSHGGNVELVGVEDGVVRLRLVGSCHSCPSSAVTMRQTIEEAIVAQAPDAAGVEVEEDAPAVESSARVALPIL